MPEAEAGPQDSGAILAMPPGTDTYCQVLAVAIGIMKPYWLALPPLEGSTLGL
jgi:hypothetical protein